MMTYPRSHLVDPHGGVYHLCSRCVRRAFLCGNDQLTGYNFDHRKQWLEDRILALADIFAIDLYGYAVMSNHYHLIVNLEPARAALWTDEEVVDRWLGLSLRDSRHATRTIQSLRRLALLENPAQISVCRERLGSLSLR